MKKYLATLGALAVFYTLIATQLGATANSALNQTPHNRDVQIEAMSK